MQKRASGLPAALTSGPVPLVTATTAANAYSHPRPQIARLTRTGLLHRVSPGRYIIVPQNRVGDAGWLPTTEGTAAVIAMAEFGRDNAVLVGVSAARIHHAIPRALAVAVVAVPKRKAPLRLTDRDARCIFVQQDTDRLDAELTQTDLGECLVTTVEQTVLDLVHRPNLGGVAVDARLAIAALLPRCSRQRLERIASTGRRGRALQRLDRGMV